MNDDFDYDDEPVGGAGSGRGVRIVAIVLVVMMIVPFALGFLDVMGRMLGIR